MTLLENISKVVYLQWVPKSIDSLREELMHTLIKAGFDVLPKGTCPENENDFIKEVENALRLSNCAIHILGSDLGKCFSGSASLSYASFQYQKSKDHLLKNKNFKIFVWHPTLAAEKEIDSDQLAFINELENNIEANMTYSNTPSIIQLADDIRSLMEVSEKTVYNLINVDIFFINNLIDENTAAEVLDMLGDVTDVEMLSIKQDSDIDYAELSAQQIKKSKMAVVYFKESAEWALPFAQQIWKNMGGAASTTPILVIGDEDPQSNKAKKISAPKMTSSVVSSVLIPLEIKFQFDKIADK